MKIRFATSALPVFLLVILLTIPSAAMAQDTHQPTLDEDVLIEFGETITFTLSMESPVAPLRAALSLRTSPDGQFQANVVEIITATTPQASIEFDVGSINLLPFAQFEYYWQIDFADGSTTATEPSVQTYLDERYSWQELSRDGLSIHWVDGDLQWAQDIHAIAEEALPGIRRVLAVPPSAQQHVYVYPSQTELQNSLRQAGILQASAHALPELGVVLIAGESGPETLIRLEQELPHELVHVLLYERMGAAMDNMPVWLNEGLATLEEQSPRRLYAETLARSAEQDELIQMESLCTSFPISGDERVLAYAQSASFTDYLIDIYGTGGIVHLLDAYEEGTTCTGGVQRVYQRSLDQLESEWRDIAFESNATPGRYAGRFYVLTIAGVILTAVVFLIIYRRRRIRE